jgi:hypothetical protein
MWSRFTIVSDDPPVVVLARLEAALTTDSPGWLGGPTTFRGAVEQDRFWVIRNLAYLENGMSLLAKGKITPKGPGTSIEIVTGPQWWHFSIVALFFVVVLSQMGAQILDLGVLCVAIGFFTLIAGVIFAAIFVRCTIEERIYKKALTRILAPTSESTK